MVSKLGISEYNLRVLLYDGSGVQTVKLQSLYNRYLKSGAYDTFASDTLGIIRYWMNHDKDDDYERFEEMGITESTFENLLDLVYSLRTNLSLNIIPDQEDEEKNWPLDTLYYKLYGHKILSILNEMQEILDEVPSELLEEKNIVHHETTLENNTTVIMIIGNPFKDAQKAVDSVRKGLEYYEQADINVDKFNYEPKFEILKDFYNNIIKEDLDENETKELVLNWQRLLIHSFSYSQIRNNVKPDTSSLICYFDIFESRIDEIDEDEIKKIYQKHINDKVGEILRPLIEDLIPYYKYLHTNDGLAELTMMISNEGESLFKKKFESNYGKLEKSLKKRVVGASLIADKYINGIYFNAMKIELINLPDESYQHLLQTCFDQYFYNATIQMCGCSMSDLTCQIELPYYPDPENDLIAQKYYIVWLMMAVVNGENLYMTDKIGWVAAIFLSILPWRLQSDSEQVRNLESLMKKNICNCIKNFHFRDTDDPLYKKWHIYIQNTVWKATKPLSVKSIDNVFDTTHEGTCCNIF